MKASVRFKGIASVICGWIVLSVTVAAANDRVYFFHNDHLGTPQVVTDLAGRTVWTAEYEPFGNAVIDQDPDGDGRQVVNNLRFPGQYHDAETGLHYNWHRDYDPETGRYLQPDPIGLEGGLNLYAYVDGNPVNLVDPAGLSGAKPNNPYHPPLNVAPGCKQSDSCAMIKAKIWILERMLYSHIGWVYKMPFSRGEGPHAKEIRDLLNALANCERLKKRNCDDCKEPPKSPPSSILPLLPFLVAPFFLIPAI